MKKKIQELIKTLESRGYRVHRHTWGTQIFLGDDILPISPITERELFFALFGLATR